MIKRILLLFIFISFFCGLAFSSEDFTTFTENDPDGELTITSTQISFSNVESRNTNAYVYKSITAKGDCKYNVEVTVTSSNDWSGPIVFWGLSSTSANTFNDWTDGIYAAVYRGTSGFTIGLGEVGGSYDFQRTAELSLNTTYYITIERIGDVLNCYVYSDSVRTTMVGAVGLKLSTNGTFSNLYAFSSRDISTTLKKMSGHFDNMTELTAPQSGSNSVSLYPSEDTHIRDGVNANTNYDTQDLKLKTESPTGDYTRTVLMKFDLSSIPSGATIRSAIIRYKLSADASASTRAYGFKCLRNWVETQATWNDYSTGNSWTTAGARSDGNDISGTWGDGTGRYLEADLYGIEALDDTRFMVDIDGNLVSYIQNNIGGSINIAIFQNDADNANHFFYDSENATTDNRPLLYVTYDTATSRRIMLIQ